MPTFNVGSFEDEESAIRFVRLAVFVEEQGIPRAEEFDDADPTCIHIVARSDGHPVGTGRLSPTGRIGRVAVVRTERGRGVGRALMKRLEREASDRGIRRLWLAAQVAAVPFYERLGYRQKGDPFIEAGIPHRWMERAPT